MNNLIKKLNEEIQNYEINTKFMVNWKNLSSSINLDNEKDQIPIILTEKRKHFLKQIFSEINEPKTSYLLTGTEGIGKTFTLYLLAHFLRISKFKANIFFLYIPDCNVFDSDFIKVITKEILLSLENCEILKKEENLKKLIEEYQIEKILLKSLIRKFLEIAEENKRCAY